MNPLSRFALLGLTITLGACSVLQGDKIDYKSAATVKTQSLEVPPDLTQLSKDSRYSVPGSAITASAYQVGQVNATTTPTAAASLGDVRIERSGTQRWLVISRSADKLWEPVKDFWTDNGFLLAQEQANLGIMETDWAENRAKLPQDFIRNTLGKLIESVYSTGERDKFRTRLERNEAGGTDIFISHRGMIEVYNSSAKDQTVWQPRPADPELEAEFLRRLMVKLGVTEEQSKVLIASGIAKDSSRVSRVNGQPVLQLDDGFDRAWRRVGLALDRIGFAVEDRDRASGVYYVRYADPEANSKKDKGLLSKLAFWNSEGGKAKALKYQVRLKESGETTDIRVFMEDGKPANNETGTRITSLLYEQLK